MPTLVVPAIGQHPASNVHKGEWCEQYPPGATGRPRCQTSPGVCLLDVWIRVRGVSLGRSLQWNPLSPSRCHQCRALTREEFPRLRARGARHDLQQPRTNLRSGESASCTHVYQSEPSTAWKMSSPGATVWCEREGPPSRSLSCKPTYRDGVLIMAINGPGCRCRGICRMSILSRHGGRSQVGLSPPPSRRYRSVSTRIRMPASGNVA